ncbi:putative beta-fructofuranosidase [Dioscorea sansibarensis]
MATTHESNPICLLLLFCCYCFIFSEKVEVVEATRRNFLNPESPEPTIVSNLYRTSYHFQPPHNWMNGMSNVNSYFLSFYAHCF